MHRRRASMPFLTWTLTPSINTSNGFQQVCRQLGSDHSRKGLAMQRRNTSTQAMCALSTSSIGSHGRHTTRAQRSELSPLSALSHRAAVQCASAILFSISRAVAGSIEAAWHRRCRLAMQIGICEAALRLLTSTGSHSRRQCGLGSEPALARQGSYRSTSTGIMLPRECRQKAFEDLEGTPRLCAKSSAACAILRATSPMHADKEQF